MNSLVPFNPRWDFQEFAFSRLGSSWEALTRVGHVPSPYCYRDSEDPRSNYAMGGLRHLPASGDHSVRMSFSWGPSAAPKDDCLIPVVSFKCILNVTKTHKV